MEFNDVIHKRESIRSYDPDKPVDRNTLNRILEAGRIAPSASNYQPWEFWVVTSKEMLDKVKPCYTRQWINDAPHILVVSGDMDNAWERSDGFNSLQTDLAIAMHQIVLAATNEGVGSCWVTNFNPAMLRAAMGFKESVKVFGISPLGYPRADYVHRTVTMRKPLEDVAFFI